MQYPSLWTLLDSGLSFCSELATMAPDDSRQQARPLIDLYVCVVCVKLLCRLSDLSLQIAKLEESARRVRVELTDHMEAYDPTFVKLMSNLVDVSLLSLLGQYRYQTAADELGGLRNRNEVMTEDLISFGRNFNPHITVSSTCRPSSTTDSRTQRCVERYTETIKHTRVASHAQRVIERAFCVFRARQTR